MSSHIVPLPALGEITGDVLILKFLVDVGDAVAVGDPIVLIETDKVEAEVTSPCTGVLRAWHVEIGTEISAGTPLATIEN
jgi:pyruvate/2-oxoglutarate dehydrogenase complex dihydrolipoamide acyltransferase (E2) component